MDVTESGRQIGEKLFILLTTRQKDELIQYILRKENVKLQSCVPVIEFNRKFIEIREGDLYFCLERRFVSVRKQVIDLTAKEFDILALFITNQRRVFTYEMIMDLIWQEDCSYYSRKAVNNHISNLRGKLKIAPDVPDYIKSVHSVGYKFEP